MTDGRGPPVEWLHPHIVDDAWEEIAHVIPLPREKDDPYELSTRTEDRGAKMFSCVIRPVRLKIS